jgi:hypothetical protein
MRFHDVFIVSRRQGGCARQSKRRSSSSGPSLANGVMVDLQALPAPASRSVGSDEGALAAVADEYNIPDFVRM